MNSINILVSVDGMKLTQSIKDKSIPPGTQENPTNITYSPQGERAYICMTTQSGNVDNQTQGGSELEVKANPGDTLQWTMQTFGSNMDHTAFIYAGQFSSSNYSLKDYISTLRFLNIESNICLPPNNDPKAALAHFNNFVYVAKATIIKPAGLITYNLSFVLVDNSDGSKIGHFKWDPYINVIS